MELNRPKVLVCCLGIKSSIHFSLYESALLESQFDVNYLLVTSENKLDEFKDIIPQKFQCVPSTWSSDAQTTFYRLSLFLRVIFWKETRSNFAQWLRYSIIGNQRGGAKTKSLLAIIFHMVEFAVRDISRFSFFLYSLAKYGSVPSNSIRFPGVDRELLQEFLNKADPDIVLIQSTLNDLSLANLLLLLAENGIPSLVLVDSWDNIGSKPVIPKDIRNLLVLSPQQRKIAMEVYGLDNSQVEVFGTPRISHISKVRKLRDTRSLRIGYLQAMPADDLQRNLEVLLSLSNQLISKTALYDNFEIEIRTYPLKSERKQRMLEESFHEMYGDKIKVQHPLETMEELFRNVDVVVSEITTAGIEAACKGIPTIFIASDSNQIYMNGRRALSTLHACELEERGFGVITGTNKQSDFSLLQETLNSYVQPDLEHFLFTSTDKTITERLITLINNKLQADIH